MASKSSRDLLVRVRYQNPIPPPPFPPKLLNVSTNIHRLGDPSYLSYLSSSTPLPMLVDSELGMPLELNSYPGIWNGDETALNPPTNPNTSHDPIDTLLLTPLKPAVNTSGEEKPTAVAEVSWMRNSSLFTRKTGSKKKEAKETPEISSTVDASEAAQLMAIDKTFSDVSDPPQHPEKPRLSAVEVYDILPDVQTWGNDYVMVKFPERPGSGDARLAAAVLRPVLDDDQHLMEYFLPREDGLDRLGASYSDPIGPENLAQMEDLSQTDGSDPKIDEIFTNVHYDRIRTYEVLVTDQPPKEVLLVLEETSNPRKRPRGAYYKEVNMRSTLRKTRSTVDTAESWDKTRVGYRLLRDDEIKTTDTVSSPGWVNEYLRKTKGTNAAEGLGEAIDEDEENM